LKLNIDKEQGMKHGRRVRDCDKESRCSKKKVGEIEGSMNG